LCPHSHPIRLAPTNQGYRLYLVFENDSRVEGIHTFIFDISLFKFAIDGKQQANKQAKILSLGGFKGGSGSNKI